jgi:hypothetical protein
VTYLASRIKRFRATKAEVELRRARLFEIISAMRPMTVRQVFYQAAIGNLVEKSEAGYDKVQADTVRMRRVGKLPYDWLTDNARWQRKPRTFNSVEEALRETARLYRKSLWSDATSYVEVWLEETKPVKALEPAVQEQRIMNAMDRIAQAIIGRSISVTLFSDMADPGSRPVW